MIIGIVFQILYGSLANNIMKKFEIEFKTRKASAYNSYSRRHLKSLMKTGDELLRKLISRLLFYQNAAFFFFVLFFLFFMFDMFYNV